MNRKFFLIFTIFFASFWYSLAFEAKISTNVDSVDLWNNINLRLEITTQNWWFLEIWEVKWIENFNILSRSQSNSFSSRTAVVNWETKSITNSVNYVDFILSPKSDWNFVLGPITISWENEVKQTNSLNISVNKNNRQSSDILVSNFENYNNNILDAKNLEKNIFSLKYLPFIILIILFLIWVLFYKINPILFEEIKNKILKYLEKWEKTQLNKNDDQIEKITDFENKTQIIYPDELDTDFINKIEIVLKQKINKKYYIKNFENISYTEILEKLDNNLADKEILEKIIDKLNKLKYSNILVSKNEILELVKKI